MRLHVVTALMLFALSFSVFGLTASRLGGYEPETAAITEGLVKTGRFAMLEASPLRAQGVPGKDNRTYGRVGVPQPILEAPFYVAGDLVDTGDSYTYRNLALRLYNPFIAALAVVAVFGIVLVRLGSYRAAVAIALLVAFASMVWPYSKIGMDTTGMAGIAWFYLFALLAAHGRSIWPWIATGALVGVVFATTLYLVLAVVPAAVLLWPALRSASRGRRRTLILALCVPVAAFLAVYVAYNYARFGTLNESEEGYLPTRDAPINFLGVLFSPGKGLILYSPLVVLGALGLREMWRDDRRFAIAILGSLAMCTLAMAGTTHWADETWGPRYVVPVAFLGIVPIAWWCRTRRQRAIVAAVACLAVVVQLVGVVAPYQTYPGAYERLTGVDLIPPRRLDNKGPPFGPDPLRWIPALSPLLVQGAVVVSSASEALGGPAITLRYAPHEGQHGSIDLNHYAEILGINVPDFWWALPVTPEEPRPTRWIAVAMLMAALGSAAALVRLWRRPVPAAGPPLSGPMPALAPVGTVGAAARRQLGVVDRTLVARQLQALDAELIDGEQPRVLVAVAVDGRLGAAVATSDALLIATGRTVERIPVEDLRDVVAEHARWGAHVRLRFDGRGRDLAMIWPAERAQELVDAVAQAPLVAERP
jgi:hypothetical protein